uniref:Calmodulin-binding transcription activator 3 isoform X2 n=2 Tax=Rhizophora mucronata TaxID=61149 RepID=A0A2P2KCL2_RHIMU
MADSRNYLPKQLLDLTEEARNRWLRTSEIMEILCNYELFPLNTEPPVRPAAGSLFLFNRKALRYFRKDGHCWRKKKDGKTVREAHEKLKAGSKDVLHCYYAHGEDNHNFQRRCYWLLDKKLDHIVLVHYLEVKEGSKSGASHLLLDSSEPLESCQPTPVQFIVQKASPTSTAQTSYTASPNIMDSNREKLSSEFEGMVAKDGLGASSLNLLIYNPLLLNDSLLGPDVQGFPVLSSNSHGSYLGADQGTKFSLQSLICDSNRSSYNLHDQNFYVGQPRGADFIKHELTDAEVDSGGVTKEAVATGDCLITHADAPEANEAPQRIIQEYDFNIIPPQFRNCSTSQTADSPIVEEENRPRDYCLIMNEPGELKKLDSFGRWMNEEIGGDCDDSLMASDSGKYWNSLDAENNNKEVSSFSHHMQLDIDSLGPSLSQEQLFSICDFSPDWACTGHEMKVLIIGTFLGSKKLSNEIKWGCMFGEIEVPAEVVTDNCIRCKAPPHATGCVPFYVTCCNRLACSEVREFEYRECRSKITSLSVKDTLEEGLHFQLRLARLLSLGLEGKRLDCSEGCNTCKLRSILYEMRSSKRDWESDKESCSMSDFNSMDTRDELIQRLLKEKLCEWLVYKVHEGGKGPDVLDDEGQGVLHFAAGLGYTWAVSLIVVAGGNPNFRDMQGRTGLHWASYFGREEMVIELVRLGVDPTAVDDPTTKCPGGQCAADLASIQGHKGIAAFLAEAFLTRQLRSLSLKINLMDSTHAIIAAEKAAEAAAQAAALSTSKLDEQLLLKGSLAAVTKSARAAALIQEVYRADSFRQRQMHRELQMSSSDISEISLDLAALGCLNKVQKSTHFEDYLHSAAVRIQQKYRGWKGRKEFLKIRNRIVKIQAHVRGHQVRKQYKKVVWSVGIVEKAILRWRRKGAGLRGFHVKKGIGYVATETGKMDEYEFLRISRKQKVAGVQKALSRVQSMVRNPEACDQYMRLVTKLENLKMSDEGTKVSPQGESLQ